MDEKKFKISNFLKQGSRPASPIRLFILMNACVLVVAFIFLLHPVVSSWRNARALIGQQQQTYIAFRIQVDEYPNLYIPYQSPYILPYAYLVAAMDDVINLAKRHDLDTVSFATTETASSGSDGNFVEITVLISLTGQNLNAADFTYELSNGVAFVRSLSMESLGNGMVTLEIEFSLFGRGE